MSTTGIKKNLRGAQLYAPPHSKDYRDNYDRIFGKRPEPGVPCEHAKAASNEAGEVWCERCGDDLLAKED